MGTAKACDMNGESVSTLTLKYVYVRIMPTEVTGRRFLRAPEPERH